MPSSRLILPLLAVLAGPLVSASCRQPDSLLQARADRLLDSLHQAGHFNGAVVFGRAGQPLYARGFGLANREAALPFTPATASDGGSLAKTLAAASIFLLQQEGRLRLDDPVRQHIPEYPHSGTTIRHLLTHSAGLPAAEYDFFNDLLPPDSVRTTAAMLRILRDRGVPPDFAPGSRFRYSSLGFDAAVLVVERVTGERWDRFLERRFFSPLGMTDSYIRPARLADWNGARTLSYRKDGDSLVVFDVFDNEGFYGGSNLYFSTLDLYQWSRSFYTRPVLDSSSLAQGALPGRLADPADQVSGLPGINLLGWYYAPGGRYHYPGALQGFWSSAYRDERQGYAITYMVNVDMPQWLRPLLSRALIDIVEGREPGPIEPRTYLPLPPDSLPRAAGRWEIAGIGAVRLGAEGRYATVRVNDGLSYPAYPIGGGQLYVPGLDAWIGFLPGRGYERIEWLSIFTVGTGARSDKQGQSTGSSSRSRTGRSSRPLVAMASPPNTVGLPRQSVKTPPASVITGSSGAVSHAFIRSSIMISARPVATRR